jgi:hypothetical protein
MDLNSSLDIIIKDLKEAREIIDDLRNYKGVPLLQVELAKSKCRNAEELIALLKTIMPQAEKEEPEKAPAPEPRHVAPRKETLIEISDEEPEKPAAVKEIPEPVKKEEMVTVVTGVVKQVPEQVHEKRHEKAIFADSFPDRHDSLNEQLGSSRREEDFAASIKSRPVNNLDEAIGVNDKFLFIREIFRGDQSSYSAALDKLNMAENISDARAIVMSYTGEGDESEAVKLLLDIVKRKFTFNG